MSLTLKTAATVPAVTLAEAKAHLRITASDDDSYITALVAAVSDGVEKYLRRALTNPVYEYRFAAFPEQSFIRLPMGRVSSVESVKYLDSDGALQTFADYTVGLDCIYLNYGSVWPTTRDIEDAVLITYTAGYLNNDSPESGEVPAAIKQAILLQVGNLFENRESVTVGQVAASVPMTVEWLLSRYQIILV